MSVTIETKKTKNCLLISIPTDEISAEEIEEIISSLKTELVLRKSKITEAEAEAVSEEIKSDWWKKNGSIVKNMIGR